MTTTLLAAELAALVPAMSQDCADNNAALIKSKLDVFCLELKYVEKWDSLIGKTFDSVAALVATMNPKVIEEYITSIERDLAEANRKLELTNSTPSKCPGNSGSPSTPRS